MARVQPLAGGRRIVTATFAMCASCSHHPRLVARARRDAITLALRSAARKSPGDPAA